jgi:hypothetical protein
MTKTKFVKGESVKECFAPDEIREALLNDGWEIADEPKKAPKKKVTKKKAEKEISVEDDN